MNFPLAQPPCPTPRAHVPVLMTLGAAARYRRFPTCCIADFQSAEAGMALQRPMGPDRLVPDPGRTPPSEPARSRLEACDTAGQRPAVHRRVRSSYRRFPTRCIAGLPVALLFLLAWLGFAGFAARAAEPTLAEVGRALAQADNVVTGFVQERHLSLFDEPLRSEGWLCFKRPGNIRWEVTKPYQSILISDGSGVAQFEWVDERWKKLDIALAGAMQNVVSQIAGVMEGRYASGSKDYAVSLTNSAAGPVIQLVPQHEAMRKMMQSIEVHLAPDLKRTTRVVLRETGGDFTDIRFTNQTVGVSLPAKVFDRAQPTPLKEIQTAAMAVKP